MSPQNIKQEEACVEEMLTGGQIEPSEQPVVGTGGVGDEEGRRYSVLCGLPPVEFSYRQRCISLAPY